MQSFGHVKPLLVSEWDVIHLRFLEKNNWLRDACVDSPGNTTTTMTYSLLRRPCIPPQPTNHATLVTLLNHACLSNSACSVLWSSVRCNGSSEKQPRRGPQNTHKGQGPKDTLRVIAVSAVCQRWSPGLISGALIALQIKPSVSVQRSVSCLFACFCLCPLQKEVTAKSLCIPNVYRF